MKKQIESSASKHYPPCSRLKYLQIYIIITSLLSRGSALEFSFDECALPLEIVDSLFESVYLHLLLPSLLVFLIQKLPIYFKYAYLNVLGFGLFCFDSLEPLFFKLSPPEAVVVFVGEPVSRLLHPRGCFCLHEIIMRS